MGRLRSGSTSVGNCVARIVIPGQSHHVVQRGHNRQDVFFVDADRLAYLEFLREHCERFGFNAVGYCQLRSSPAC